MFRRKSDPTKAPGTAPAGSGSGSVALVIVSLSVDKAKGILMNNGRISLLALSTDSHTLVWIRMIWSDPDPDLKAP